MLGEPSFKLQDFDFEVFWFQLRAAFLAFVAGRLQDVVGRPEVEARINRKTALGADELIGQPCGLVDCS